MKLCKDCTYFSKPSWWKKYTMQEFAEECRHPELVDVVLGNPKPCKTMRIVDCKNGDRFIQSNIKTRR